MKACGPWLREAAALDSDVNFDVDTSFTEDRRRSATVDYNYRPKDSTRLREAGEEGAAEPVATTGTDVATYMREQPGMSAFAVEDGVVYHTYSAYARGLDGLWGMYQWLDRAPRLQDDADLRRLRPQSGSSKPSGRCADPDRAGPACCVPVSRREIGM